MLLSVLNVFEDFEVFLYNLEMFLFGRLLYRLVHSLGNVLRV